MKNILFRKIFGEPTIIGSDENGFQIMRGSKAKGGGKDVIAKCDTKEEADELIEQLKAMEK